jgi:hypothetical protein
VAFVYFINSPACFNATVSGDFDILKLVVFIFFSNGFIEGIIPATFALTITPNVPVIASPACWANFLPFRSSIISKESLNYTANAMALASPLSIDFSINV